MELNLRLQLKRTNIYSHSLIRKPSNNVRSIVLRNTIARENYCINLTGRELRCTQLNTDQEYFEELYLAQDVNKELQMRSNYYYKRNSQSSGMAIANRNLFSATISYAKNYTQLANKMKRVLNSSDMNASQLQYIRDKVLEKDYKIRVETQLKNPHAISNLFNYRKHEVMVKIINLIIEVVESSIIDNDKFAETVKLTRALDAYKTLFKKAFDQLKSIIQEELKLMTAYNFKIPTFDEDPPPE